jgi:glycosyltransferase involved in cell wall biosynthesis
MKEKTIRFTISNEEFWGNGLIYTQNLLPLIKLLENNRELYNIEVHSFLSILDLILYRKQINNFKKEFQSLGIKTIIYPTFFVRSRFFVLRWFVLPLYILSTYPYLLYLMIKDFILSGETVIYHLRSYPIAFLFNYFYKGSGRLIFDPRSDFNHENKKVGFWQENSLTDKMWYAIERKLLTKSSIVIFISEPFRDDLLLRHKIENSNEKHFLFYNPIDFRKFEVAFDSVRDINKVRFLYTGSLNNWNNLETYLDFFLKLKKFLPAATFYIVTSTRSNSFQKLLGCEKYSEIVKDVTFFYGLSYSQLPVMYKDCSIGLQLMD